MLPRNDPLSGAMSALPALRNTRAQLLGDNLYNLGGASYGVEVANRLHGVGQTVADGGRAMTRAGNATYNNVPAKSNMMRDMLNNTSRPLGALEATTPFGLFSDHQVMEIDNLGFLDLVGEPVFKLKDHSQVQMAMILSELGAEARDIVTYSAFVTVTALNYLLRKKAVEAENRGPAAFEDYKKNIIEARKDISFAGLCTAVDGGHSAGVGVAKAHLPLASLLSFGYNDAMTNYWGEDAVKHRYMWFKLHWSPKSKQTYKVRLYDGSIAKHELGSEGGAWQIKPVLTPGPSPPSYLNDNDGKRNDVHYFYVGLASALSSIDYEESAYYNKVVDGSRTVRQTVQVFLRPRPHFN